MFAYDLGFLSDLGFFLSLIRTINVFSGIINVFSRIIDLIPLQMETAKGCKTCKNTFPTWEDNKVAEHRRQCKAAQKRANKAAKKAEANNIKRQAKNKRG